MTIAKDIAAEKTDGVSRRALLAGGLAGGFLLTFHLPLRAGNEPVQPPDVTAGKFAPNAFMPRPTKSCMRIRFSGSRRQAAPRRSAHSGSRSAQPVQRPAPCSSGLRRNNGRSSPRHAPLRTVR